MSYKTTCPECGATETLRVVSANIYMDVALTSTGFELDPKGVDTADEQVECSACAHRCDLDDLYQVDEPKPSEDEDAQPPTPGCSVWFINPNNYYFAIRDPHELSIEYLASERESEVFTDYELFIGAVMKRQNLTREEIEPYTYVIEGDNLICDRGLASPLIDWDDPEHPETLEDALIAYIE